MSASAGTVVVNPAERLEVLFDELAELTGQRNAIDGRIVEIVAEIDRDQLWGSTGARSVPALVAWKTGCSPANAHTITTVASRLTEFPRCVAGMREGRLSLDQVGVIAARAGQGSDEHYAQLAGCATVNQLRTAVRLEPRPEPEPRQEPERLITTTRNERARGQHTTVVLHVDVEQRAAALHLGPLLTDAERRYLTCDATCEVWFERNGEVIGAGRATRLINRRLRRALEHRHPMCAVPGCGATRRLHAHHIRHWQDGGQTELANVTSC